MRLGFGAWGRKAAEEVPFSVHRIEGRLPCSSNRESACHAGGQGLIPGLGSSSGEGNGNHCSILAWRIPGKKDCRCPSSLLVDFDHLAEVVFVRFLHCEGTQEEGSTCSAYLKSVSSCSTVFSFFWLHYVFTQAFFRCGSRHVGS